MAFRFRRISAKYILKMAARTILGSFDLQVAPIIPTKILVNWPFVKGE